MRIKPVKNYKPPAYPTIHEAKQDARLLEHLPRRWKKNAPIASLMGSGLLLHFVCAGCNNSNQPKNLHVENQLLPGSNDRRAAEKKNTRVFPATRVAPMLEDALANDGRGGFGCIAVSAPVFLSEAEALELIRAELEKAGLKLDETAQVDGLQIPAAPARQGWRNKREKPFALAEGVYTFDFGTADKSVAVKFLSAKDDVLWEDTDDSSTYVSYNYARLATRVSDAFKQRETGDPVVIGLFFEPSVYPVGWDDFDMTGLANEQKQFVRNQIEATKESRREVARDVGREKLRAQISHFVEYLKQEGVVE